MTSLEIVRVHLSPTESSGVDLVGVALCYTLQEPLSPTEVERIERALGRVVDKWRLLAARIEPKKENGCYVLAVPTVKELPSDYKAYNFTSSTSSENIGVNLPKLDPAKAAHFPSIPIMKRFYTSAPVTNSALAKAKAPLTNLHVSVLSDCTCVGLTLPHGVFDAIGMGQIVRALDGELNDKPWDAPPLEPVNVAVEASAKMTRTGDELLPPILRDITKPTYRSFAWFLATLAYEILWQKSKSASVYLGEEVVARIVDPVKAEVAKTGEWVSTGDVLYAWILKTAFLDEPNNTNATHVMGSFCGRSLLATASPSTSLANGSYPHNCTFYLFPPAYPVTDFSSLSLATIALDHRRTIELARKPAFIRASLDWFDKPGQQAIPARPWGTEPLIFTNQTVANLTGIDWGGGPLTSFWWSNVPLPPDHALSINKLNGGYLIMGSLRTARWNAVASEVDRLNGEGERRVV